MHSSIDARGRGFIRACELGAQNHDLQWEVLTVPRGSEFVESTLSALLALDDFPDAICCQMDMMAIPLALRLGRYGHHTPQDYSIIGFDDAPYASTVGLTTMRQNPREMGRIIARKGLSLIRGESVERPHELVKAHLVLRDTDQLYTGE